MRLRGAANKANLTLSRPTIVNNRIKASGRVTSRARGMVRLQLEYQTIGCAIQILRFRGSIGDDGSWKIDEPLTPPAGGRDRDAHRVSALLHAVHRLLPGADLRRDAGLQVLPSRW